MTMVLNFIGFGAFALSMMIFCWALGYLFFGDDARREVDVVSGPCAVAAILLIVTAVCFK